MGRRALLFKKRFKKELTKRPPFLGKSLVCMDEQRSAGQRYLFGLDRAPAMVARCGTDSLYHVAMSKSVISTP